MLTKFIIFIVIELISLILLLIFNRKISRPLSYSALTLINILLLRFTWFNKIFPNIGLILLIVISYGTYYTISSNFTYDFTGKIISYRYIFNQIFKPNPKKECRIIGSILPYNNYQLKYNGKYIVASEIATAGSTLISGAIGSGKSFLMENLIKGNLLNGFPVIFCDYKGDEKMKNSIKKCAAREGYEVYEISQDNINFSYDPLRRLSNTGKIEAILNMRKWGDDGGSDHYKTGVNQLLQDSIKEFSHIYAENGNKGSYTLQYNEFLRTFRTNDRDAYLTVSKLLNLLITSYIGEIFEDGKKVLSLDQIIGKKFIIICSFKSESKDLATSFSSLFFKDLLNEYQNANLNKNIFLYIDEFATCQNLRIIQDIEEKGRSAKIATTLAIQDINQIIDKASEAYLNSLLGLINTFVIFNGVTRTTAEKLSGLQLRDIEDYLMNLRKPLKRKDGSYSKPTAMYISSYPTVNKKDASEVFRFIPYNLSSRYFEEKNDNLEFKKVTNNSNLKENFEEYNINEYSDEDNNSENNSIVSNDQKDKIINQNKLEDDTNNFDYNDFI